MSPKEHLTEAGNIIVKSLNSNVICLEQLKIRIDEAMIWLDIICEMKQKEIKNEQLLKQKEEQVSSMLTTSFNNILNS